MADFLWVSTNRHRNPPSESSTTEAKNIRRFVQRRASFPQACAVDCASDRKLTPEEPEIVQWQPPCEASNSEKLKRVQASQRHGSKGGKSPFILPQSALQGRWRPDLVSASKRQGAKEKRFGRRTGDGSTHENVEKPAPGSSSQGVHIDSWKDLHRHDKRKPSQDGLPAKIDTYLSAGRVDPFGSMGAMMLPPYADEVLYHAITTFWPSFIPTKNPQLHPIKSTWLEICRNTPMVLFSFLFGAAENLLSHQGGVDPNPKNYLWRSKFHGMAIKLINEQISNLQPGSEPTDELLACILTLAVYGSKPNAPLARSASALSKAQTLEVVSHRDYVQAHKDALYYLVGRKGGLSKVKMYGISILIQATDILWSTFDLKSPILPWSQEIPALLPFDPYQPNLRKLGFYMATGFSQLPNVDWPAQYIDIIDDIRRFLITLQEAQQSRTTETRLEEFVRFRNWLQHRLLSLHSATSTTDMAFSAGNASTSQPTSACIDNLEITRTTLLMLSTFIIFPIPTTSKPSRLLSHQLLALLDCAFIDAELDIEESQSRLLVWSAMLGAINASDIDEQARFTVLLRSAARRLRIDKEHWEVARELLVRFLWWDDTLGGLAKVVWHGVGILGLEEENDSG